ncbi:MAG: hypothetical protein Q8Q07_03810 [Dehalococcoidales bacterium]|nr:hypothetical protein [Dehalococcoidales bacterium]
MDPEKRTLCKAVEAELIGASAFMEAEELLDGEGPDYFRGFMQGYSHCLQLAEKFDALYQSISSEEELQ